MDRRTRNLFALALVVVILVSGGAALLLGGAGVRDPNTPANADSMVGVIVAVDARSLDDVRAFTLRQGDGSIALFVIGTLENGAAFPPGHLVEHQATGQPVRVWYRTQDDVKLAIRLEDAT